MLRQYLTIYIVPETGFQLKFFRPIEICPLSCIIDALDKAD